MIEPTSTFVPKLPKGLIFEVEKSLCLLLHPNKPRWVVTNELGQEIVGLCDGKNTVQSISQKIASRYGQHPVDVENDVKRFLKSLEKATFLLTESDESTEPRSMVNIKSIFLHLTDRCNLQCVHCYAGSGIQQSEELDTVTIVQLIDELAQKKGRAFILSGGEPLLRDDWYEILKKAKERLERVTLNTNGVLIDKDVATRLTQIRPRIQISLDGPSSEIHDSIRGHGSFEKSLRGIQILQDKGLGEELVICMTLMKNNIASAREMIDLVRELGVSRLRFLPLHRQGRASASWNSLDASFEQYMSWFTFAYYGQNSIDIEVNGGLSGFWLSPSEDEEEEIAWCPIGRKIVVTASGDIYPCALLMTGEYYLGNVKKESLTDIENSPKLHDLTGKCYERRTRIEKCHQCSWRNFCQGSCPALPYLLKGTLWDTDDFCDFRKKIYRDSIQKMVRKRVGISGEISTSSPIQI